MPLTSRFAVKLPLIILLASAFSAAPIHAQQARAPVSVEQLIQLRKIEADEVSTPQFDFNVRGMSTRRDGRRDWLMLRAEYRTALEWTDEVTVTFYVVLRGEVENLPRGADNPNMFTGTVTYMNVKKGDHEATMFLDHNTFERYGDVVATAAVVTINGQDAGFLADPQPNSPWWKTQPPVSIPLLTRAESPWALIEIEKHDTIKP
jgi:hypothetical protein